MSTDAMQVSYAQGWSVADLDRLPDDGRRYELIDGVVSVAPAPSALHQQVANQLWSLLQAVAPSLLAIISAVGVVLADDQCPIPDVVAVHRPVDFRRSRFPGEQVLLAVEVVSPSTRAADRLRKPGQYSAAGIPFYWRVELEPLHIVAYLLDEDGVYTEYKRQAGGKRFSVIEPFPVEFDPADLLP